MLHVFQLVSGSDINSHATVLCCRSNQAQLKQRKWIISHKDLQKIIPVHYENILFKDIERIRHLSNLISDLDYFYFSIFIECIHDHPDNNRLLQINLLNLIHA